jgi:hypothetical protein
MHRATRDIYGVLAENVTSKSDLVPALVPWRNAFA